MNEGYIPSNNGVANDGGNEFDILDVVRERASASSSNTINATAMNEKEVEKERRAMDLTPITIEKNVMVASARKSCSSSVTTKNINKSQEPQKQECGKSIMGDQRTSLSAVAVKKSESQHVRGHESRDGCTLSNIEDDAEMSTMKKKMSNGKPERCLLSTGSSFNVMHVVHQRASLANAEVSNDDGTPVDASSEPPRSIIKGQKNVNVAQPGAYSGAPGVSLRRLDNIRFSLVGVGSDNFSQAVLEDSSGINSEQESLPMFQEEEGKKTNQSMALQSLEKGHSKDGEGDPVVVEGSLDDDGHKGSIWRKKKPVILLLFLVFIIAVVVAVVIVLANNSNSESETLEQQQQQQQQQIGEDPIEEEEEWVPLVPNMTNATLAALEDPFSPQSLAYEWIAKDPDWDTYEDWRKQQRFAMMCFYNGYSGDPSKLSQRFSPTLSRHECEWIPALDTCEGSDRGAITKIGAISPYQLSFTRFTPEIGFLTHLEEIDFSLGLHMKHLEDLFPLDVIKSLPPIKSLKVDRCELGGSIPSTLGLITSLTSLDLPDTGLVSTIPSQLGLLSDLETLTLSSNALTGSIPKEIGELPSLINFDIRTNPDLEPPIPSGFCMDGRVPFESLITDWCFSPAECCGS